MTLPEPVLLSIYNAFPRRTGRPRALQEIALALTRICEGEIDGKPRSPEEAIAYLREKVEAFSVAMAGREKKWIAHPATWLHQMRYLRAEKQEEMPERLEACIAILALYPKMPSQAHIQANVKSFLPALRAIDTVIAGLMPGDAVEWLSKRTATYAACVATWPEQELQYVPSATRWFSEGRYVQDERTWVRSSAPTYQQEREQVRRLFGG